MSFWVTKEKTTTIGIHRLTRDWGEGASDAPNEEGAGAPSEPGDASWNFAFFDSDNATVFVDVLPVWQLPIQSIVGELNCCAGYETTKQGPRAVANNKRANTRSAYERQG